MAGSLPSDATVDLTSPDSIGTIFDPQSGEDAIFANFVVHSGTGTFQSFVRLQATSSPQEQGFNTDAPPTLDTKAGATALLLSNLPIDVINGVAYYEFHSDINELTANGNNYLSLDAFQVYQSSSNVLTNFTGTTLTGYTPTYGTFSGGSSVGVYNLDASGDHWIALNASLSSGSGTSDFLIDVPVSQFNGALPYVYVYSAFGFQPTGTSGGNTYVWGASDGFEEWNTEVGTSIGGHKFNDLNGNGIWDSGEPTLSGWKIFIDLNNDGNWQVGEPFILTDSNGAYQFTVVPGNYNLAEVPQAGWTETVGPTNPIQVVAGNVFTNLDFGNVQVSSISGTKYEDFNGNGQIDPGDIPLQNWTIHLLDSNGNTIATDITDSNGNYLFDNLLPGTYGVKEDLQTGWIATTGTEIDNIALSSGQDITDKDFLNFQLGSISGYKYEDLNGNGQFDPGEPPISGWTIKLEFGQSILVTTTDSNGFYQFSNLGPGDFAVTEDLPAGWFTKGPVMYPVTITSGLNVEDRDFFNFQQGDISGFKYNDLNANGQLDPGEPGLPGWTIDLFLTSSGGLLQQVVTDSTGFYHFTGLDPNTYTVSEVPQINWTPSTPFIIPGIVLTSGSSISDVNFLNYTTGSISGFKYNDINGNGQLDPSDTPLQNWTIHLLDSNGITIGTTVTDVNGFYQFSDLHPGTYGVKEDIQAGWTPTTNPEIDNIIVQSLHSVTDQDFLNFQLGSISGFKYNDFTGNGILDGLDTPLQNWTIHLLDSNGNTIATTITDGNGFYHFDNLAAGTYGVKEDVQSGWTPTTSPEIDNLTITSGSALTNENFLNFQLGSISGFKYEDLNGNGQFDPGDPPLANWEIHLDSTAGTLIAYTDSNGFYHFDNVGPGIFSITEVNPSGWFTHGITGYGGQLMSGENRTGLDFVNFQQGSISGFKYNDLNGDGVIDPSDPGLAGWVIDLFGPNGFVGYAITDSTGAYSFTGLDPGTYNISEELPPGWIASLPPIITGIVITSGSSATNENFLNFTTGSISGIKYNDINGNGQYDSGDVPLSGWTIDLFQNNVLVQQTLTDGNGAYSFAGLHPGTYTVKEVEQPGWFTNATTEIPDIVVTSGSSTVDQNFFNFQKGTISGFKYEDLNANGHFDTGEPPLQGWLIDLKDSNGIVLASAITDNLGVYHFTNLDPGTYSVAEELKPGWHSVAPTSLGPIIVTSGSDTPDQDFFNYQNASVTAFKFNDLNGNGVKNVGEPPMKDVTFFIDTNHNGKLDLSEISAKTDANGLVTFDELKPGSYTLVEQLPSGMKPTIDHNGDGHPDLQTMVTLISGQHLGPSLIDGLDHNNVTFGNVKAAPPPSDFHLLIGSKVDPLMKASFVDAQRPWYSLFVAINVAAITSLVIPTDFVIDPAKQYSFNLEHVSGLPTTLTTVVAQYTPVILAESATLKAAGYLNGASNWFNDPLTLRGSSTLGDGAYHYAMSAALLPGTSLTQHGQVTQAAAFSLDGNTQNNLITNSSSHVRYIYGDAGDDVLKGSAGIDYINGGPGHDYLYGNAGNDIIVYDPVDRVEDGGVGNDILRLDGNTSLALHAAGGHVFSSTNVALTSLEVISLDGSSTGLSHGVYLPGANTLSLDENSAHTLSGLLLGSLNSIDPKLAAGLNTLLSDNGINPNSVLHDKVLLVNGDAKDTVHFTDGNWHDLGTDVVTNTGGYNAYIHSTADNHAIVMLDTDIQHVTGAV